MSTMLIGWAVVHSLWQCTVIAGLTALVLSLLPDRRASARYRIACASLLLMMAAPAVTAFMSPSSLASRLRFNVIYSVDAVVTMPDVVPWALIILPAAGAIWGAGVLLGVARLGFEWRRVLRLRSTGTFDVDDEVRTLVADLRAEMAVGPSVDVQRSTRASVPMVVGWRRALILLPTAVTGALAPGQLRGILAHELAHVRRADYLVNLLQVIVETLLFHHPAARWVSRRIRTEREYCCDDAAVAIGGDRATYARALSALEDARGECHLAVAAASGTLLDRIQRIAGAQRRMLTPARGVLAMIVATLVAAVMLALTLTVPPRVAPGMKLRRPGPPPAGMSTAPDGQDMRKRPSRENVRSRG